MKEDPSPDCSGQTGCPPNILGTWVVNGGSCSSVISFSPKINWKVGLGAMAGKSGGAGGSATAETVPKTKNCNNQPGQAGISQNITVSRPAWCHYGPKNATKETEESQNKHDKANMGNDPAMLMPITAELRIQGDPREVFCDSRTIVIQRISLVVINPFHLFGGDCGDWLALPGCNEVLSNKQWWITGIDHSIKEGSYVTTLKLRLPVPGIELNNNVKLGGGGNYKPPNLC